MLNSDDTIEKDIDVERRPSITAREKYGSTSSTIPSDFNTSNGSSYPNGDLTTYPSMKGKSRDPKNGSGPNGRRRPPRFYLNKFRVPIYIQLCVVICILCGLCVMVVAVTTYVNDRQTLLDLQGNNLVTIAVLKSVQLNQTIGSLYNQIFSITTRVLLQHALVDYYALDQTPDTRFPDAYSDLNTAIGTQTSLYAGRMYDNNFNLLPNLTISDVNYEFPSSLIPTAAPPPPHAGMVNTSGELLGPVAVPAAPGTYAFSITIPILNVNSSSSPPRLGYLSVIVTASGLQRAVNDTTGMGQTGQLLVVAKNGSHYDVVLPPARTPSVYEVDIYPGQYPAIDLAFKNKTGFLINTHNAFGAAVSVGYTFPALRFVEWGILAEELKSEVYEPVVSQQKLAAITSVVPYTAVCLFISLLVIIFVRSIQELSRANKVTLRAAERTDDDTSSRVLPDPVNERTWWFRDEISDVQRSHNIMRDQLLKQYESLEDQVRIKTAELHNKMEELEVALSRVEEEKLNTQNALQVKEEALSTQERLMHSVAHDLKTPLNGILAPLESCNIHSVRALIVGLESPVFSGDEKLELKDAYLSVRRLKRLTEDLTKYAEDVRFGRINPQVFVLGILHTQSQFDFQSQFQDKNLSFTTEFRPESCVEWQVYGDYYRISQVCNNFIQNAIKFTKPGGRVTMRIKARGKLERPKVQGDRESSHSSGSMAHLPSQFSNEDSSNSGKGKEGLDWHVEYFEFEVEDNGIGMADEDLSKIFEPWHQLADDKTHNEGYGGIGLGLAICQFWVTKMDGKIEVSSRRAPSVNERGRTIFQVLLPLRVNRLSRRNSTNSSKLSVRTSGSDALPAPRVANESSSTSSTTIVAHDIPPTPVQETIPSPTPHQTFKMSQKRNCRILIAEDEPINQRVVQRMLTKDGFHHISFAQNGFEAIEAVSRAETQGEQFNLILMDFQMPHIDGPLAATVIRRMPHIVQDRLTIVALTAYDDDKSKRECLSAGMNDFITKPISHNVLRDTLMRHLSLPSVPENEAEDDSDTSPASPRSPASTDSEKPSPTADTAQP